MRTNCESPGETAPLQQLAAPSSVLVLTGHSKLSITCLLLSMLAKPLLCWQVMRDGRNGRACARNSHWSDFWASGLPMFHLLYSLDSLKVSPESQVPSSSLSPPCLHMLVRDSRADSSCLTSPPGQTEEDIWTESPSASYPPHLFPCSSILVCAPPFLWPGSLLCRYQYSQFSVSGIGTHHSHTTLFIF